MYLLEKIDAWSERHHPRWLDILRILLGMILLAKGLYFISHTQEIVSMLQYTSVAFVSIVIAHYVAVAHLVGGVLIIAGLLTRVAVLFQIPILVGAFIFVHLPSGVLTISSEIELSILVLFLLLFFLVEGSGPWSVDHYIATHDEAEQIGN